MKKANTAATAPTQILVKDVQEVAHLFDPGGQQRHQVQARIKTGIKDIAAMQEIVNDYKTNIREVGQDVRRYKQELLQLPPTDETKITKVIEEIKTLPWVQSFDVTNDCARIVTHPNVLKTTLDTGIVVFKDGENELEFLLKPIEVPLPQYKIKVHLPTYTNSNISDNTDRVAIKLIDQKDISNMRVPLPYPVPREPRPHWATSLPSFGSYKGICMGDYHDELKAAAKKSLPTFLREFAEFLQTCTDGHAYKKKGRWAAYLGKPEYDAVAIRAALPDETPQSVQEKYSIEYRKMHGIDVSKLPEARMNEVSNIRHPIYFPGGDTFTTYNVSHGIFNSAFGTGVNTLIQDEIDDFDEDEMLVEDD